MSRIKETPADAARSRRADRLPSPGNPARVPRSRRVKRVLTPAERRGNLVIDLVMCLCFSAGCIAALFEMTGFDTSLWYILMMTAANVAVLTLIAWKWWALPSALALGTGAVYLIAYLQETIPELHNYWIGFYDWIVSGLPKVEPYTGNGSVLLVAFGIAFPITLFFYLFCRKLFSFWLSMGLTVGVVAVLEFTSNAQSVPALCLMLGGLLLSLPGVVAKIASRGKSEDQIISRHTMQLVAIPVTLVCVLAGWAFAPHEDGMWKNESLNYLIGDIGDFASYITGQGENGGSNYALRSSGYQPLGERLGGDVKISTAKALEVETNLPILLAGSVNDTYDGEKWTDAYDTGRFRFQSLFWRGQRGWVYQNALPLGDNTARTLYRDIAKQVSLRIATNLTITNALFSNGSVENVTIRYPSNDVQAFFNLQGELFSNYKGSHTYYLETTAFDTSLPYYREKLVRLEEVLTDQHVADPYITALSEQYMNVPESVEQNVYDAVEEAFTGFFRESDGDEVYGNLIDTPAEKVFAISDWLTEHMTYTITPGKPDADRDFVSQFIENGQGYCTYYASAMAVMARIAGVPSRYVTGFSLTREFGEYVARNSNAHAWCEVYLAGIGWVTVDPLGPRDAAAALEEEDKENDSGYKPNTGAVERPSYLDELDIDLADKTADFGKMQRSFSVWVAIIPGVGLAILVGIIVWHARTMKRYFRLYSAHKVVFFMITMERSVDYLYEGILGQLRFYDLQVKPGETFGRFAERVDERMPFAVAPDGRTPPRLHMKNVVEVLIRERYALRKLVPADVELVAAYFSQLEVELKAYLGESSYFWKRAVKKPPSPKLFDFGSGEQYGYRSIKKDNPLF